MPRHSSPPRRLLARLLALSTLLLALPLAAASATDETTLTVRVADPDGLAIERARVYVLDGDSPGFGSLASGKTDADGQVVLTVDAQRHARVVVRARGWAPTMAGPFHTDAESGTQSIDVRLETGGSVRGVALDRAGEPLGGKRFVLNLMQWPDGGLTMIGSAGRTEPDGSFLVEHLAPGLYLMTVTPVVTQPFGEESVRFEFEVTGGEVKDLGRAPEPVERLRGSARILLDGTPLAGARITDFNLDHDEPFSSGWSPRSTFDALSGAAETDAEGRFEIEFESRPELELNISHFELHGYTDRTLPLEALLAGDQTIRLESGVLAGIVRGPDGAPVAGCPISASCYADEGSTHADLVADQRGRFEFSRLIAGTYDIEFGEPTDNSPFGPTFEPLFIGRVELEDVVVAAGERVEREVELSAAGAVAVTVVKGDSPVAGAQVEVDLHQTGFGFTRRRGETDPDGRVTLGALPQGQYRIEASSGDQVGSAHVEIAENAIHYETLELGAAATLLVDVPDVEAWKLRVVSLEDLSGHRIETELPESGTARFARVPAGEYRITAYAHLPRLGFTKLLAPVTLEAGTEQRQTLTPMY